MLFKLLLGESIIVGFWLEEETLLVLVEDATDPVREEEEGWEGPPFLVGEEPDGGGGINRLGWVGGGGVG